MKIKPIFYFTSLFLLLLGACTSDKESTFSESDINIIPQPNAIKLNSGSFTFDEQTQLVIIDTVYQELANVIAAPFQQAAGFDLRVASEKPATNYIVFETSSELPAENYTLDVTSDHITLAASDFNGFLYGLESIIQLLPLQINSTSKVNNANWVIPNVSIQDGPQFKWRGLMLDVSRHFFKKEYVLKTIDRLAFHKLNKLHLHLVDDQGWRIEIKKYPKLTEIGAYRVDQEDAAWNARRKPELGEKATFGGFYTQEDIKEIVAYAQTKGVEVIPEIEMPAHVMSAIASYPELSCKGEPIMVPSGGVWPITDIFCPGKESTFEFLENVFEEIIPLFPSQYIHAGGDEATKTNWETCPHCQKRIKEEGLESVEELQSYFMERMEKYIVSKGKKMIGWDEILEGGLAPEATVMSWRGFEGGWEASEQGHDVIMTPTSYCYFDYYQGPQDSEPEAFNAYLPLSRVYQFSPVLDSMSAEQKKHILGGQANLWSEFIPTSSHSEYMIYPRIAALSEALWTNADKRDWLDFTKRIQTQFERYEYAGINYAKSAYAVMAEDSVSMDDKQIILELKTEIPNTDIRYTLDGSELDENALKYSVPIVLSKTADVKAAAYKENKVYGAIFQQSYNFHKAFGKQVTYNTDLHKSYKGTPYTLVDGVNGSLDFHDGKWQGWLRNDMDITIDLGEATDVSEINVRSLESQGSGIYFPSGAKAFLSVDGNEYHEVASVENPAKKNPGRSFKNFKLDFEPEKVRFVKVIVSNPGQFIFLDEVQVN
ncbi:glycoside hydrolase family 20 protein [Chondrinema litorale]|uniref:glycoside hydrolase family 20 protein n=1 Tax=Chondrinema litorale TaxID=2994555 RepID=UPI0025432F28|nr:glycoside hydrolase family 20 protein [Chondrinema litorale]UZR96721.1 glycoside hydrolase family 20 protein [Chondrinema litorale]